LSEGDNLLVFSFGLVSAFYHFDMRHRADIFCSWRIYWRRWISKRKLSWGKNAFSFFRLCKHNSIY